MALLFKNNFGQMSAAAISDNAYSVNGDRYRAMIHNYLIPNLNGIDLENKWFQHVIQPTPQSIY